ncbi:FxsA family protein [Halostella pelagica]|uniref:FxsA family protein n=1 Tax=Halostella pelagica TaxID=2583824 RepID=UPI001080E6BA|nr:FxsA family protein [Halostella pelagica]
MLWWLLALLLIPLLDAVFLVYVAVALLGGLETVLLVVLTALVGMLLVRAEGRRTMRKLQTTLGKGRPPTNELLDGGLLIAAGAFLLTPGLVTDAIGFLLAIPPTRALIRGALKRWVVTPYIEDKTGGFATGNVYTFGFPDSDDGNASEDTYDLGNDAYDVDLDDDETAR